MTDRNNWSRQRSSHGPDRSLSPSPLVNQVVVSSRHPYITDNSRLSSPRSAGGSSLAYSRPRSATNGRSSIQMEPGLQALLAAEGRAAEMIATARTKRNERIRQANRESQAEIAAFRSERELQYKMKLHEATQLERFQAKLDSQRHHLFEQMEKTVKQARKSLVQYIMGQVIDQIPVGPRPNAKRVSF